MELPNEALRGKGWQGAPEVGHSERVIRLFAIEVTTSDQILGNW